MFRSLSLETIRNVAPSVFTEESANHTSEKYQYISTEKVIVGLMAEGFMPTQATQSRTRLADKMAYTKHMLRFRHVDSQPTFLGLHPEIILVNSHDGLSSYRIMAGLYRLVCSNGLVAGKIYNEIRIRHQGDILSQVIDSTYSMIENSKHLLEVADHMASITLDEADKKLFAKKAHAIRFKDSPLYEAIASNKLLGPRRRQEVGKNDLFTIFNVVQENVIKGGLKGYAKDEQGYPRTMRSRAVNSIDQSNNINRDLWTLAENTLQLKAA